MVKNKKFAEKKFFFRNFEILIVREIFHKKLEFDLRYFAAHMTFVVDLKKASEFFVSAEQYMLNIDI